MVDLAPTPAPAETPAVQARRTVLTWGILLALGWGAFGLLLFVRSLSSEPSTLAAAAPGPYQAVGRLLPAAWAGAPITNTGARAGTLALYVALVCGLWAAYLAAARAAGRPATAAGD